jgi:hypothetical protein
MIPAEYKYFFIFNYSNGTLVNFLAKIVKNNLSSSCTFSNYIIIYFINFLRRDEFAESLKKGKTSGERWKIFQLHVSKYSVS